MLMPQHAGIDFSFKEMKNRSVTARGLSDCALNAFLHDASDVVKALKLSLTESIAGLLSSPKFGAARAEGRQHRPIWFRSTLEAPEGGVLQPIRILLDLTEHTKHKEALLLPRVPYLSK